VLRRKDVGEADRLLTVFARSLGKQRLVARGVRRTTSRMAAHLEPSWSNLHVVERRAWPLVTRRDPRSVLVPVAPERCGCAPAARGG
jgi:DNA repair protein RecO (recombination protein O)